MSRIWLRRAFLAAASAATLVLAACGSGTIESQLTPSRIVVFGDAMADLGQNGNRYTVNDGTLNIWTERVAVKFNLAVKASATGGTSYATAHARVNTKPDAVGNTTTPTVKEQVDAFLAVATVGGNDLFILNAGTSDVIAEGRRMASGGQTTEQMMTNLQQAGRDLAAQARRLVDAGARYVVIVGTYNLGRSPWATASAMNGTLENASGRFNDAMLVALVDLGDKVLYVDAALQYNLMIAAPTAYDMQNSIDPVCTSVDPGPGIGIGVGEVNSALCTPATILAGADYNRYLFADKVYPTPRAQVTFGDYAFSRIRSRW